MFYRKPFQGRFLLEIINRRRQHNSTTQVGMMLNPLDDRNQLDIKLTQTEEALRERQISEERLLHELHILEEKYSLMKQMCANNGSQILTNDRFEKQIHELLNKNKNLSGQVHLRRENERLKTELDKLKTQQIPKPAKCKYFHNLLFFSIKDFRVCSFKT